MVNGDAPRRLPRAERERQVLEVATRLFAEQGYAALTMDDLARTVGVTKPLLYAYFGNKERLYLACMAPAAEALIATVAQAVQASADDPVAALERATHAFFAFVDADRDAWRVLFDGTVPAGGEIAEHRDRLLGMVAAPLAAQLPPGAAVEVEALSAALLGAAEALGRWWLSTGAMSAAAAADLLVSTVQPGLRARTRPRNQR